MTFTIKQLKDLISSYNDTQELDFIGLEDIIIITKESILTTNKKLEECIKKIDNELFSTNNEMNDYPSSTFDRMVLPRDIMELLDWSENSSTRAKLESFANTVIQVWNPTSGLISLDHKKLNNTTLSRALFITKTQGKRINPKDKTFNIDEIIDRIITINLPYLKQKYNNNN